MALPTHVQSSGWVNDVADVVTITLTGVVTGNTILVAILCTNSATPTYTVTDAPSNTYTERQRIASTVQANIWSAQNVTTSAGTVVITITASGAGNHMALAVEVGIDNATPFDVADQLSLTTQTSHFCAPSTAIDTAVNVYCLSCSALSGTSGGATAGASWNSLGETSNSLGFAQYRISAAALTDERGPWSTVTARSSRNVIASFNGAASGVVGPLARFGHLGGGGILTGGRLVAKSCRPAPSRFVRQRGSWVPISTESERTQCSTSEL